jgi:hypothetical protein
MNGLPQVVMRETYVVRYGLTNAAISIPSTFVIYPTIHGTDELPQKHELPMKIVLVVSWLQICDYL